MHIPIEMVKPVNANAAGGEALPEVCGGRGAGHHGSHVNAPPDSGESQVRIHVTCGVNPSSIDIAIV